MEYLVMSDLSCAGLTAKVNEKIKNGWWFLWVVFKFLIGNGKKRT